MLNQLPLIQNYSLNTEYSQPIIFAHFLRSQNSQNKGHIENFRFYNEMWVSKFISEIVTSKLCELGTCESFFSFESNLESNRPSDDGRFFPVSVGSIHRNRLPCRVAVAGQAACIAIGKTDPCSLRKVTASNLFSISFIGLLIAALWFVSKSVPCGYWKGQNVVSVYH